MFSFFKSKKNDLSILPERFVIFDLETTGLKPDIHEIIEIGAIRVNRDSNLHDTFQILICPRKKIPSKITSITGITQSLVEKEGESLEIALSKFFEFVGELPLVTFNADFDMGFLTSSVNKTDTDFTFNNKVSCALKMARRAWPGRKSYRLSDIAKDAGLSTKGTHRALADCKLTLTVYSAAATKLGSVI